MTGRGDGDGMNSCVTVVTLSYNVPDKLVRSARSLTRQLEIDEYILIENHSSVDMTGAYDEIREICQGANIRLVFHRPNVAFNFSEGQNWGLDHASNDLVLLMNNDAYLLTENTLRTSIQCLSETVKIVGHKILNSDMTVNHFGVFWGTQFNGAHMASGFAKDHPAIQVPVPMAAVTAACVLVVRTDIRFDPVYWFEHEDVDFCFQHRRRGYELICNPECEVVHDESSTRGVIQKVNMEWVQKQQIGTQVFVSRWRWTIVRQWLRLPRFWHLFGDYLRSHYSDVMGDIVGVLVTIIFGIVISSGIAGFSTFLFKAGLLILGFYSVKRICSRILL